MYNLQFCYVHICYNYRKSQKFRSGQIVGQSFAITVKNSAQPSFFRKNIDQYTRNVNTDQI